MEEKLRSYFFHLMFIWKMTFSYACGRSGGFDKWKERTKEWKRRERNLERGTGEMKTRYKEREDGGKQKEMKQENDLN